MFSFSFGEILVIATVGLIVIGPERLPETVRFVGRYVKYARRHIGEAHAYIRREMQMEDAGGLEDMKNIHRDLTQIGRDTESALRNVTTIGASEGTREKQTEAVEGNSDSEKPESESASTELSSAKAGGES